MGSELDQSWNFITNFLFQERNSVQDQHVIQALEILCANDMHLIIEQWFFEVVQQQLRSEVAPHFWAQFEKPIAGTDVVSHIQTIFDDMYLKLSMYWTSVKKLESIQNYLDSHGYTNGTKSKTEDLQLRLVLLFKAILFPVFPKNTKYFHDALQQFYSKAFKAYDVLTHKKGKPSKSLISENEENQGDSYNVTLDSSNETDMNSSNVTDGLTCIGCEEEVDSCQCKQIMATFHQLNHQLRDLGLLERLGGEVVSTLIHDRIQQHIELTCKGNFETEYLHTLEDWLETKVVGWLKLIYGEVKDSKSDVKSLIHSHKERLLNLMYETYAHIHIDQMFTIIIEYPESLPGLQDLKICLEKVNLRGVLVQSLRQALETRLLHPGVNTTDILTAYINAIRALRVLDPSGVLLDLVCEPVRCYLRSRDDTVRCVVSSLTEDSNSELSEELMKNQSVVHDDNFLNEDDIEDWENWQPDPVDADPDKMSGNRRSSDIISMLINIYGSKELFVNEYRTILADRILTQLNYDTEKEIRYLEHLKVKFGEAQLHFCEVMLKDVADSRRINTHVHEQKAEKAKDNKETKQNEADTNDQEDLSLSALILSAEFWPAFREEKLKLPQFMEKHLEMYTEAFEGLKGNRTLCWKPHLGQVHLEIDHKGKTLDMTVSPIHATIIWHFQEKARWSIEELATVMQMPTYALRRKMAFWQSNGLLKEESTDVFALVEEVKGHSHDADVIEEEEVESAMATAQDKKEEELNVIWQYVVGMLTNLDSLPLERIYSMLKMFAIDGPGSEYSIHQLKEFLDKKVKEHKLVFSGGVFRLPKPDS